MFYNVNKFILVSLFLLLLPIFAIANEKYFQPVIAAITINNIDSKQPAIILADKKNQIWMDKNDLDEFHIQIPDKAETIFSNERQYYCLDDIQGISYKFDTVAVRLYIRAITQAFSNNIFNANQQEKFTPQSPQPGMFLNYDFFMQKQTELPSYNSGLFELVTFNRFGVGTSQFLIQNTSGTSTTSTTRLIRLNTLWNYDDPEQMSTLSFGDTISVPAMWNNAVSFGGIQWGTNFATKPYFNPFPLPFASGTAVVPSTASIYVNNALYSQREIPPGPFTFNNIPVVNGAGNVQLVVTNPLGQQQIISVPYFTNNQILKKGLHDYGISVGFLRQNYGISSNDYGQLVTNITDSYGVTDRITTQWNIQAQTTELQAAGFGLNWQIDNLGVLNAGSAFSHSKHNGYGALAMLGFNRQTQTTSYGISMQAASHYFNQIGQNNSPVLNTDYNFDYQNTNFYNQFYSLPKLQTQAFFSFQIGKSSVGISYINQQNRDNQPSTSLLTASYSFPVWHNLNTTVTGMTNIGGTSNRSIFLTLSVPIGSDKTLSSNTNIQSSQTNTSLQLQKNLPLGTGYGYNLAAQAGNTNYILAGGSYHNDYGYYTAQIANNDNVVNYQAEVTGGLVWFAHDIYLTRQLNQSFAVVKTDDFANIPIYLNNQQITKTNKNGFAFVPNLNAYQDNQVSIDSNTFPLDAAVNNTRMSLVPYNRSGAFAKFAVHHQKSVLFNLYLPSGEPVPAGAEIYINDGSLAGYVGTEGNAYLTQIDKENHVIVKWDHTQCSTSFNEPTEKQLLYKLGNYICS